MDTQFPFALTVCGIEELTGHGQAGVSHVLSILDPDWPVPEAFGSFGEHAKLELRFHDVIEDTPDHIPPREEDVRAILAFGRDLEAEAASRLLVHCHAGISRSTAAMALILAQAKPAMGAEAILQGILAIREKTWPNLRILEMGDAMLGRGGSLPEAAAAIYAHQLRIRPHLAEVMRKAGRGREVDAAEAAG
ncbi:tyrosine phosphatase family protein [Paracraurococcus ruber]|uniref:Protein-tyrosine-phosphatase n=1 Tax=Paracraurococcus ruber TaxID=77675 RepID=A0ABS1CYM8_9PROT|nr:protein-tyrosine-phosphatase [Paracraurococcus ruber]MBK1659607.1 protein-tyrosine-phosphatase [Paracraurococcus ruber]TDG16168.1 protein-tyrosine-phosphatase [Paracraurococcus ruber]